MPRRDLSLFAVARPLRRGSRLLASALMALVLAAGSLAVGSLIASPAAAASAEDCDLVARPAASISLDDTQGGNYSLGFDIDGSGVEAVENVRIAARLALANHSQATRDAVEAYLDSIVAWYRSLDAPCAGAEPYPGPFANPPEAPGSPYGFGGIDVKVGPSFAIVVNGVAAADEAVAAPADVASNGPALAHSGSESFVLVYFGAGLTAFGATALGMRRWMSGPLDEPAN